jgi:hypothetical protein
MHEIPNKSSNSSKTLHRPTIQSLGKPKGQPIGLIPTRMESFLKGLFKPCIVSDMVLGMSDYSKT